KAVASLRTRHAVRTVREASARNNRRTEIESAFFLSHEIKAGPNQAMRRRCYENGVARPELSSSRMLVKSMGQLALRYSFPDQENHERVAQKATPCCRRKSLGCLKKFLMSKMKTQSSGLCLGSC